MRKERKKKAAKRQHKIIADCLFLSGDTTAIGAQSSALLDKNWGLKKNEFIGSLPSVPKCRPIN